ncbi:MAG: hypothetical protein IBX43_08060 [Campylobacterales bacterium]|nr:hypothetical protein [Campylobacterales bacterium]
MQKTPIYLSDKVIPIYKFALIFAFLLSLASFFVGMGFGLFVYLDSGLSFADALIEASLLFLKGAAIAAFIGFVSFLAFWKKYQIRYHNCLKNRVSDCKEISFFRLA